MNSIQVITHRGLDPTKEGYFAESSIEAFKDQLARGYGLEFDVRKTKDRKMVIMHDKSLSRITKNGDRREIIDVTASEILKITVDDSHFTTLDILLSLIQEQQAPGAVSALHLKSDNQNKEDLDILLSYLENIDPAYFFIFDTTVETAKYLKERNRKLQLAPSVAHPYDINRFNDVVGGTLLTVNDVLRNRELFNGVWLDEWDLQDENEGVKKFYTKELVNLFRSHGLWVGLVTPELHGTSPGLLGGEAHPSATSFEALSLRFNDIVSCAPDAICTDYPDYVKGLCN